MRMTKLHAGAVWAAAWVAGAGLVGPWEGRAAVAQPAAKAPAGKLDLTPQSLPKLQALIRPHGDEWRHLRVRWLTDPVAVLNKAVAEDKPIVFLNLGGAGYNHLLGAC